MQQADIYTKKNLKSYFGKSGRSSLSEKLLREGFLPFVTNIKTEEIVIQFSGRSLIGTVNDKEYDNTPICSPINLFCRYPKQRMKKIKGIWLKYFIMACTSGLSLIYRGAKINKVVQVNNKPADAIAYPKLTREEVKNCKKNLLAHFPDHSIIFPRIDKATSPELIGYLLEEGFWLVPTKTSHIYHPDGRQFKRSHTKRDFALLKKQPYTFVPHEELFENDLERIHELYLMLFIEKHTRENPDLTLNFFKESHKHEWYRYFGIRNKQGVIDGFFAYEVQDGVMACGPLGYDTLMPQSKGLYRMLFAHSLRIARENRWLFNFGGGNETFKMNRGSFREIAYTAVYCKHLPVYRRVPWWLMGKLGHRSIVKILRSALF